MKHFQNSAVAMENSKCFVCIHLFKVQKIGKTLYSHLMSNVTGKEIMQFLLIC